MSILDLPRQGSVATPTGVLVYDGPAHTAEWYAARRAGITATDMVKVLGYSEYGNATSVWADKVGRDLDEEAGEAAQWGLDHEPAIARRWSERHGARVRSVGVLAHVDRPHHRASLDALVDVCPDGDGPCGVQYKTRSAFKAGQWKEDVPDDVYLQEQWEMHVAGFRHVHVACLLGGNRLVSFRVDRDPTDLAVMIRRADEVWAAVQANEPPADAPSRLLTSVLNRLYPDRQGQQSLDVVQAQTLLDQWQAAKQRAAGANAAAKAAKHDVETAEAAMVAALHEHQAAFAGDNPEPVFAVVTTQRSGYTVAPTSYQQIKVTKAWTPEGATA